MIRAAASVSLLLLCANAVPIDQTAADEDGLVFSAPVYSDEWTVSALPGDYEMSLHVLLVLRQSKMAELKQLVTSVSDPRSAQYGDFLTAAQVSAMTAPLRADVAAVERWAPSCTMLKSGGALECTMSVATACSMFSTKFFEAVHAKTRQRHIVAGEYSLPASVAPAIAAVVGLHELPLPSAVPITTFRKKIPPVTPAVLHKVYGIEGVNASGSIKNRQAVVEFQGQYMKVSDLTAFFAKEWPALPKSAAEVYAFHPAEKKKEQPGIEAQLDIQYIMGTAPGIKTEFWGVQSNAFCKDLKNWTETLLGSEDIPLVHSVSYGWQGNLTKIGCKPALVSAIDDDFAKLAARGITIIFASGDSGSGYAEPDPTEACFHFKKFHKGQRLRGDVLKVKNVTSPKGKGAKNELAENCCDSAGNDGAEGFDIDNVVTVKRHFRATCRIYSKVSGTSNSSDPTAVAYSFGGKSKKTPLWPSWPASSPWVTSVGATRFHNDVVGTDQAAVSREDQFGSGGGFSAQFPQAAWQKDAVDAYFKNVDPSTLPNTDKVSYAKNGRATPDVSALGTAYTVYNDGKPLPGGVGGTSASAPAFAGMVSLLNDARMAAGKKPLGFLNPFVYQNAAAFTDITVGSDKVGRGGEKLKYGFNCSKGWDPVTGLGTPIFGALLKAALAAP